MGERKSFRELDVWRRGKVLAVRIYRATAALDSDDRSLREQMRRAAVSVPSNIAEGAERFGTREAAQFFSVAKGSLAEVQTQLEIAQELGLMTAQEVEPLVDEAAQIARMLGALTARLRVRSSATR